MLCYYLIIRWLKNKKQNLKFTKKLKIISKIN